MLEVHQSLDDRQKGQNNFDPGTNFWYLPFHLIPIAGVNKLVHIFLIFRLHVLAAYISNFLEYWVLNSVEDYQV